MIAPRLLKFIASQDNSMRLSTVDSKDQRTQQRSKQTEPAGEGIMILLQTQTT